MSELSRPRPSPGLLARLEQHEGQHAIASLVVAELRYGACRHPDAVRRGRLVAFVDAIVGALPVLPFDERAAEWLGAERARVEAVGNVVDLADLLIAATAASHGLVVVTANVRHFSALSVDVENWILS